MIAVHGPRSGRFFSILISVTSRFVLLRAILLLQLLLCFVDVSDFPHVIAMRRLRAFPEKPSSKKPYSVSMGTTSHASSPPPSVEAFGDPDGEKESIARAVSYGSASPPTGGSFLANKSTRLHLAWQTIWASIIFYQPQWVLVNFASTVLLIWVMKDLKASGVPWFSLASIRSR